MSTTPQFEKPPQVHYENYRVYVVTSYLTYIGIVIHSFLVPIFFWLGYDVLAVFNLFSVIAWSVAHQINKKGYHSIAIMLLIIEVVLHSILTIFYLGWQSGFQYYLMAGVPFTMFINKVKALVVIAIPTAFCIVFFSLQLMSAGKVYHYQYPEMIQFMNYTNIILTFFTLTLSSYFFSIASFASEKQMESLANTDQLTGLINRRGIHQLLDAQHQFFTRNNTCFSIVLADIDHFKKFNDRHGHHGGDFILESVSQLMKDRLRQYDVISRWGGEEFLILLPDTKIDAAVRVAEEIRDAIETQIFMFNGQSLSVTMTFGVAQHQRSASVDNTINQADDALYRGKVDGRNRVEY